MLCHFNGVVFGFRLLFIAFVLWLMGVQANQSIDLLAWLGNLFVLWKSEYFGLFLAIWQEVEPFESLVSLSDQVERVWLPFFKRVSERKFAAFTLAMKALARRQNLDGRPPQLFEFAPLLIQLWQCLNCIFVLSRWQLFCIVNQYRLFDQDTVHWMHLHLLRLRGTLRFLEQELTLLDVWLWHEFVIGGVEAGLILALLHLDLV
jgi:hypothetical protein